MAGIFTILNKHDAYTSKHVVEQFSKGSHRGSKSTYTRIIHKIDGGIHYNRGGPPVVNDYRVTHTQPLIKNCIALLCDGEIYNYAELHKLLVYYTLSRTNSPEPDTKFELEKPENLEFSANEKRNAIIILLYERFGIEETLQLLDGDFSFVLVDYRLTQTTSKTYVVRDPYGIRPLYQFSQTNVLNKKDQIFAFASELNMLSGLHNNEYYDAPTIVPFTPGCYSVFELSSLVHSSWQLIEKNVRYHTIPFSYNSLFLDVQDNTHNINDTIQYYLYKSIEKRMDNLELNEVACILTDDIESSILAAIMSDYRRQHKMPVLNTYSIGAASLIPGMQGAACEEHLLYPKILADYIGSNHTEILVTEEQIAEAKQKMLHVVDKTMVDSSVYTMLLGEFIAKNTPAKIIFTSDGANAYMGTRHTNHAIDYDRMCRQLLSNCHANDVLKSEQCLSAHGLECRMPYMDKAFIQVYMSIPLEYRFHCHTIMDKQILRSAFAPDKLNRDLVPECVLWRASHIDVPIQIV